MNDSEREAIILNSAWKMIDGMVNWGMFVRNDSTDPTNLMFNTSKNQQLFIILLGDFLSQVNSFNRNRLPLGLKNAPANARPSDLTFLFHLRDLCAAPKLGEDVTDLAATIEAFADWLEACFIAPGVNLNAVDIVSDMRVARYRYIKMCGNIAKHNLARLERDVEHLHKILKTAGHVVDKQEAYLAMDNFFEWFNDNIFIYHSSQIAEFLNNIRWAIFEYLLPEFCRSWHLTEEATPDFRMYAYRIPASIVQPVAKAMYWDVMNRVRTKPSMHRFVVSDSYKQCY